MLAAKELKVKAKKMERLVGATSKLCSEMEALDELESVERKLIVRGWTPCEGAGHGRLELLIGQLEGPGTGRGSGA